MDLCDPVSIVLVTAGSRGQSLLFRYPFIAPCRTEQKEKGNLHGIYQWAIAFNIRTPRLRNHGILQGSVIKIEDFFRGRVKKIWNSLGVKP